MFSRIWSLCACATIVLLTGVSASDPLIINTLKGKVKGKTFITDTGKEVDAWYGIPYAKPPIGDLRFRHPQPADRWSGVKETIHKPNSCVQINDTFFGDFLESQKWNPNTKISEDCLYLSVVVPKPHPRNSAVMLWIYGGGFNSGTSTINIYDMKMLAAEQNVIVVGIQYRVAALGFLHLGSSDVPGNAGLFDQLMALQWTHDNIRHFGGDSNKITLFGESAGAVSVSMHLLSPLSRGLFSQAIMQSSSATCPSVVISKQEAIARGLRLAEAVNCPYDDKDMPKVVECLRYVNATELITNIPYRPIMDFAFLPIVDGSFLDNQPTKSLAEGRFKKTNILMGSTTEEGNWFIVYDMPDLFPLSENVTLNRAEFESSVRKVFPYFNDLVHQAIMYEYTDWMDPEDGDANRDAIDKMVGDYQFTCSVNEFAYNYASTGNNVYMYYYKQKISISLWPKWMGSLHGDEIMFVFGEPLRANSGYTLEEQELSRRIMTYWANFAKTGNPAKSIDGSFDSVNWPVHTAAGREYITFSTDSSEEGRGPRLDKCAFWKKFVPQLLKLTDITEVTPNKLQLATTTSTLSITINHLPSVEGSLLCVFTAMGNVVARTEAQRTGKGVSCKTPKTDRLPEMPPGENHFVARLSVWMIDGPEFASTDITFFDCNTYSTCTECVSSPFPCDWCENADGGYQCTHNSAETCGNGAPISGINQVCPSLQSGPLFCPAASVATATRKKFKPRIIPFDFEEHIQEGSFVQVVCTLRSGDSPINIRWMLNGEEVLPSSGIFTQMIGERTSILSINTVGYAHRGSYTCIATNNAGRANHTAMLLVEVPPRWIVEPSDKSFALGSDAKIECKADGFPKPSISWKKAAGRTPSDYRELGMHNPNMRVTEDGTLHITNIQKPHEGYFLCVASNGIDRLATDIYVRVEAPPQFSIQYRNQTAQRGDDAVLECEAEGDNPIGILWRKDKINIDQALEPRYTIHDEMSPAGVLSSLSIKTTDRSDSAVYTCVATNIFGSANTNINLIIQDMA